MAATTIIGKIRRVEGSGNVDVRAYLEDGSLVTIQAPNGETYHLGQVSSSVGWAVHDIVNHFSDEYDVLFPDGWTVEIDMSDIEQRAE